MKPLVLLLLISRSGVVFAAGNSFSGSLERVGDGSISVRLADRRVIDAMLPNKPPLEAKTIAAQYGMWDQVEITCKPIDPFWEEGTSRFQTLQVTQMRLIRRAALETLSETLSPEARSKILEAVPFREGKNLLKHPDVAEPLVRFAELIGPGGTEIAHARQVNLAYVANMPNFVADESAKRFRSAPRSSRWDDYDTVESEIAFTGNRAVRQKIRRDGQPWQQPFDALPGFKWYEGFGTEITPLFDPKCPTILEYQGRSSGKSGAGSRPLLDYKFSTPVDGCFPYFFFGYQRYNPPRTGHVFIDDPAGNVIRIEEEATKFPAAIEFAQRDEHISWDYVKIGEDSHLLPVHADFLVRYNDGTRYRIEVEYRNHRHFEASSNLSFK